MIKHVLTISSSATVAEAIKIMRDRGLRALIVEPSNDQHFYGMVTETNIVYKVAAFGRNPKQMRVYEIMTKLSLNTEPDLKV